MQFNRLCRILLGGTGLGFLISFIGLLLVLLNGFIALTTICPFFLLLAIMVLVVAIVMMVGSFLLRLALGLIITAIYGHDEWDFNV